LALANITNARSIQLYVITLCMIIICGKMSCCHRKTVFLFQKLYFSYVLLAPFCYNPLAKLEMLWLSSSKFRLGLLGQGRLLKRAHTGLRPPHSMPVNVPTTHPCFVLLPCSAVGPQLSNQTAFKFVQYIFKIFDRCLQFI
jgi:hypothetical protein